MDAKYYLTEGGAIYLMTPPVGTHERETFDAKVASGAFTEVAEKDITTVEEAGATRYVRKPPVGAEKKAAAQAKAAEAE